MIHLPALHTNFRGVKCLTYLGREGMHGGRVPQTIAAAKLRLLEGVEPAIARLRRFIESPPGLCDVCGRSDDTSAIVSAIKALLDRCGLGPQVKVEVSTAEPPSELSLDDLIARLELLLEQARAMREAQQTDVLDAFLVPEDDAIPDAAEPITSGISTAEKVND
jgi:hypothetical protein